MKNINKIMLVTAVAASFALANRASAADSFMSPRLRENQTRMVSGMNNDPDLAHQSFQSGSPKVLEQHASTASIGSSKNDPDLVHQYAAAPGTPKQKELQPMQFEIAPLK